MEQYEVIIAYRTYYKWFPKESRSGINETDGGRAGNATTRNLSGTKN